MKADKFRGKTLHTNTWKYVLRNQARIKKEYGKDTLNRIIKSLDAEFNENIEFIKVDGEKYDMVCVNDIGHTVNIIFFYVIRKTFGTYTLAFREFVG